MDDMQRLYDDHYSKQLMDIMHKMEDFDATFLGELYT